MIQIPIECIEEKEIASWLERDDCRRLDLELVDGIADSCMACESAVLCDVCERLLQAAAEQTVSIPVSSHSLTSASVT